MRPITIKLPRQLDHRLTSLARRLRKTRSEVFRDALEAYARETRRSVTAVAGDLVGSVEGPSDLSTSKEHMADYGR
jgi:predicted transcriptional regulator